mmetsp:Transcript_22866/g.66023  ORF Transcript_22866/g.66023 Transcript_22866/m.66023 type:complete len:285 (+) Transcript_22866:59-913(+)
MPFGRLDDMTCPAPSVAERAPLLQAVAQAVADMLAGKPCAPDDGLAKSLSDALLAESPDASDAAAARVAALRAALAMELQDALAAEHSTAHLLRSNGRTSASSPVRAEIRGTAGRAVTAPLFAVGRAAECEVQVVGDASVLPVQFIALPLPGGIVVADLWSHGGTTATSDGVPVLPSSGHERFCAMVVPRCGRTEFRIGARSAVAFGPSMKKLEQAARKEAKMKAIEDMAKAAAARIAAAETPRLLAKRQSSVQTSTSIGSARSGVHSASSRSRSPAIRQVEAA